MRARNIKPGFFMNEQLAECSPLARILFSGLWCMADRDGRLEDRPLRIKALALPYDDVSVDDLLSELACHGLIKRYAAKGMRLISIPKFVEHQRPHPKEPKSVLPSCESAPNPVKEVRWTYFAQMGGADGPIKIGQAFKPDSRIAGLQTGSPHPITLLGAVLEFSERELHERFKALEISGEWFSPSKELLEFIKKNANFDFRQKKRGGRPRKTTAEQESATANCADTPSLNAECNSNANPGNHVAAADSPIDLTEFIPPVEAIGLSRDLAKRLLEQASDPALIREVLAFHGMATKAGKIRNPTGAIRTMLVDPVGWGFERTETGWKMPSDVRPPTRGPRAEEQMRQRREQAEAQQAIPNDGRSIKQRMQELGKGDVT